MWIIGEGSNLAMKTEMMEKSPCGFQPFCINAPQATNDGMTDKGKAPEVKDNKINGGRNNVPFKSNRQQF